MNFKKQLLENDSDYIYGIAGIENHNVNSSASHRFWFNHLRENHNLLNGDIFEFGVYKGFSLLSMGLLLKKLGSDKVIYGFDSFTGFPEYSPQDDFSNYKKFENSVFEERLVKASLLSRQFKQQVSTSTVTPASISTSLDFSDTNYDRLMGKIDDFGLDNIVIIKGSFEDTIDKFFSEFEGEVFSANIDCDLYNGYKFTLPQLCNKLVSAGYIHLDEYYSLKFPGARLATKDYFNSIEDEDHGLQLKKNSTRDGEFERWFVTKA